MVACRNTTLSADDSDQVLDRLTGLTQVISPELVRQVLLHSGKVNPRRCALTHEVTLWLVLAMGVFTDLPVLQVFQAARKRLFSRLGERTPTRAALCLARQRLGVQPVQRLYQEIARPQANPDTPGAFFHGLRLMSFDGSLYDIPDFPANERTYGRPQSGRGPGAFPQARKVSLIESGTHLEVALTVGGWHDGERALARRLFASLPDDALLLLDRGFYGFGMWQRLHRQGVRLLARITKRLTLQPVQRLPDGSYLAYLYRNNRDRKAGRRGPLVRVIEYTLDDPQRTGHQEVHRLLTNLLDAEAVPALALVMLYHERWEHELVYDEQKTHQDPRRAEKPTHLRSQTPEGVEQEVYALSLAHYVVRSLMVQAAQATQIDVDRLSFRRCFQILRLRLPECRSGHGLDVAQWYQCLLDEMSQQINPERENRINPRVVKRKMSRYAKKRPEHRPVPPLTQTFIQTVVLLI
jgi:hypothetical protein